MHEAELMARDRWAREDLLAFQREQVRALITHAVAHSPCYRETLGPDAAERPLAELPTLPKATMMAEFDRVVTDPRLHLDDLRAHLAGSARCGKVIRALGPFCRGKLGVACKFFRKIAGILVNMRRLRGMRTTLRPWQFDVASRDKR